MSRQWEPPTERRTYPETCHMCGGEVREELVTLTIPRADGTIRVVVGVPAGVCRQCREQYLHSTTTGRLDQILEAPPVRHEDVPVWEFAPSA